jgi:hypothetical protein
MSVAAAPRDLEAFPGRAVPLEAPAGRVPEELPGEAARRASEQQGGLCRVERREREPEEQQAPGECPAPGAKAVVRVRRGRLLRPALVARRPQGPEERQVQAGARALRAPVRAVDSSKINAALVERVQRA